MLMPWPSVSWTPCASAARSKPLWFVSLILVCRDVCGTYLQISCVAPCPRSVWVALSLHHGSTLALRKAGVSLFFFQHVCRHLAATLRSAIPGVPIVASDPFRHVCQLHADDLVILTASQADLQVAFDAVQPLHPSRCLVLPPTVTSARLHVSQRWPGAGSSDQKGASNLPNSPFVLLPLRPSADAESTDGPSNSRTNLSATLGWRCAIISKESPQLARYAAVAVRTALRRPMPPMASGNERHPRTSLPGPATQRHLGPPRKGVSCEAAQP